MAVVPPVSSGIFQAAATQGASPDWLQQARFSTPEAAPSNYVELAPNAARSPYLESIGGPGFAANVAPVIAADNAQINRQMQPAPAALAPVDNRAQGAASSTENKIVVGSGFQSSPAFGQSFELRGMR